MKSGEGHDARVAQTGVLSARMNEWNAKMKMKRHGWLLAGALLVGCGDGSPASVDESDASGGAGVMDMGSMVPRDQGTVSPTPDMTTPAADMGSPNVDQGGGITDMSDMADAQGDQGPVGEDMGDMDATDMMTPTDMAGGPMCGNDIVEAGELCDGNCPQSCDDGDACTDDTMAGSAATCNVVCDYQPKSTMCGADDGCCPAGCTEMEDVDCQIDLANLDCTNPLAWPAAWVQREDALFAEINMRRALGGTCGADMHPPAPALVMNNALRQAARCHSQDMAVRDYFDGRSPEGDSALDRAKDAGYMGAITVGQDISTREEIVAMVDNWLTRPGNCNHLLNARYDDSGVGYVESSVSMYPRYWSHVVADKP